MNIILNILNDKFANISLHAFGNLFININEYTVDEDLEQSFANVGVLSGKIYHTIDGEEYKIVGFSLLNEWENRSDEPTVKVNMRKIKFK